MSIRKLKRKKLSKNIMPADAESCNNCGVKYDNLGKRQMAAKYYKRAIELNPDLASAYHNLANIKHYQGESAAALILYKQALTLEDNNLDAINNIAAILYDQGQVSEALNYFRRAEQLAPNNPGITSAIASGLNYIPGIERNTELKTAKSWWLRHGKKFYQRSIFPNSREPEKVLRIGYISPDLRDHSIAYFLKPLLRHHNHSKFETFCYANVTRPDLVTAEFKQLSDHWCDISTSNTTQVARQIMGDRIDILVDLAGHMVNNRLDVLAHQAAPLQISWLGYPNTTGMPTMHYRLTDAIADPPGDSEDFYSEQLIHLPVFICYEPPTVDIPIPEPPCQQNGHITFGSFNNPAKINSQVIETWAKILLTTPNSHLLLKGLLLGNEDTRKQYIELFGRYGIDKKRLHLIPYTKTTTEHLSLYNSVDICLDTFPYNGTTTTFEALWMGLPVIVLHGDRHATRVGADILTNIALSQYIATDKEAYINSATKLAANQTRLKELRQTMRTSLLNSPLCQVQTFTEQIEDSYRYCWQQWCKKH